MLAPQLPPRLAVWWVERKGCTAGPISPDPQAPRHLFRRVGIWSGRWAPGGIPVSGAPARYCGAPQAQSFSAFGG
eukprot:2138566-Lingulodinium_polyedra.AAC.1